MSISSNHHDQVSTEVSVAKDPQSLPKTSSPLLSAVIILAVIVAAIWGIPSLFKSYQEQADLIYKEKVQTVSRELPALVKKFTYRQTSPYADETPAIVWSGADARILMTSSYETSSMLRTGTIWEVLAKTPSDRYFRVNFKLEKRAECENPLDCTVMDGFTPLTEKAARAYVFKAGKRELYRELFHEEMPPVEIKA